MGDSCYARMRMRDLNARCLDRYIRAVNHVLTVLYEHECVLYGGAVRDLIKGVCPRDFDFIGFDSIIVDSIVKNLCKNGFCAEKIKSGAASSRAAEECHFIAVDVGASVVTNAPLIVIDLGVASSMDVVQYGCSIGVLEYMEPDFNVNMLYVTELSAPYNYDPAPDYKMRSNDVIFSWGRITARSCLKYGADIDYIMQCINGGTALMLGCANDTHCTINPRDAAKRSVGLCAAGYRDVTDYRCTVGRCRRASLQTVIDDMKRYLTQEDCAAEARYNRTVQQTAREVMVRAYHIADEQIGRGVLDAELIEHNIRGHVMVRNLIVAPPVNTYTPVYDDQDRVSVVRQYAICTERGDDVICVTTKERADRLRNIANAVYSRAISESIKRALAGAVTHVVADAASVNAAAPESESQ